MYIVQIAHNIVVGRYSNFFPFVYYLFLFSLGRLSLFLERQNKWALIFNRWFANPKRLNYLKWNEPKNEKKKKESSITFFSCAFCIAYSDFDWNSLGVFVKCLFIFVCTDPAHSCGFPVFGRTVAYNFIDFIPIMMQSWSNRMHNKEKKSKNRASYLKVQNSSYCSLSRSLAGCITARRFISDNPTKDKQTKIANRKPNKQRHDTETKRKI